MSAEASPRNLDRDSLVLGQSRQQQEEGELVVVPSQHTEQKRKDQSENMNEELYLA